MTGMHAVHMIIGIGDVVILYSSVKAATVQCIIGGDHRSLLALR